MTFLFTRLLPVLLLLSPVAQGTEFPPYGGNRYIDAVPATCDLAEMAGLAITGLTGPIDAEDNYSLPGPCTAGKDCRAVRF